MLFFIGEFTEKGEEICPRSLLKRVIKRGEEMGFDAFSPLECEFFMFEETPESVREKGFKNLKPLTPDWFGYSVLRSTVHADLYKQILDMSEEMDFPVEGLHTETGPGVLEAAIAVDSAENSADKGALF